MNYKLKNSDDKIKRKSYKSSLKKLFPLLESEKSNLLITTVAVIISSLANLVSPIIIGLTIDDYISNNDYNGILINSLILLLIYIVGSLASYVQTKSMGGVGRRLLFNLRNLIFNKLQQLPIEFFNQNKTGDLISRINNDTDKLNQFISQALMQFIGNFFSILGTGIFILFINFKLGLATLLPAIIVLILTRLIGPWIKKKNLVSMQSLGDLSSEIQESLSNFKVIISFNRLDYFRNKFEITNENNYKSAISSGIASNIFTPIYGLASNLASLISLCYGLYLATLGSITIGILISFQFYVNNFYMPLRQLASIWSSFQLAIASLERIWEIIGLESNLKLIDKNEKLNSDSILEFRDVTYHYPESADILKNINFSLKKGKTYALVGPTGGGKTTTASLMARLFDPTSGMIFLNGKDIRSYDNNDRVEQIGFILQEPFIFTATLAENILYGNNKYINYSNNDLIKLLKEADLYDLLSKFDGGLETQISTNGESISIGQKQLIAFVRAFLRNPKLLILDEATANIDTVTEQLLEKILLKLPKETTKVIIAHRLNTIKNADEIFFVNSGIITSTGNMEHALEMILNDKRES